MKSFSWKSDEADMKKNYVKPTLEKREKLSMVTANAGATNAGAGAGNT